MANRGLRASGSNEGHGARRASRCLCIAGRLLACALLIGTPFGAAARSPQADVAYERASRALRQGDTDAAVTHSARAAELAPDDAEVLELHARALLADGEPERAREVLERLRAVRPGAATDYLLGLAEYRTGGWEAARDHLQAALRESPGQARIHLFLSASLQELGDFDAAEHHLREAERLDPALAEAVNYRLGVLAMQRQNWDAAKRYFEEVQARAPDSELAKAAEAYVRRIEGRPARPWRVHATAGFAWDDNVNLAGSGDAIRVSKERDWSFVLDVGGRYTLLDRRPFRVRVGHTSYLTYHFDQHDFDIYSARTWAEGSYDFLDAFGFDLRYTFEYSLADFDDFRRVHAIEPSVRWSPAPGWLARLFYRYEVRDFFLASAFRPFDRDGQLRTAGADLYLPLPDPLRVGKGFARIGYRFREESTSGDNFDAHGSGLVGTLFVPLPLRFALVLDGYYERRHYARPSLLDPGRGPRDDHIRQGRIALRHRFTNYWSAEASWRRTNWSSNVPDFDFSRSLLSLLVTFRY